MKLKTGEEILSEYRSQEQNLSTFKSLGELIDEELEKAKSFPVEKPVILETAENIVEELFQNGFGDKAQRLVLELQDRSNGGGWGKKPMIDVIVKHIESSLSK